MDLSCLEIVVEGNGSRVFCVLCYKCATEGSQDDELTCLKEKRPCHEGQKLLRERFQLTNTEEPKPFVVGDADVDSANPEILTVEEEDHNNEDDDVEIHI